MLRNVGIRTKIFAVLVVPLALLGLTAGLLAAGQVQRARTATELEKLSLISGDYVDFVAALEDERALTIATLRGDQRAAVQLAFMRQGMDGGIGAVREELAKVDVAQISPNTSTAIDRTNAAHNRLPEIREQIDRGEHTVDSAAAAYDAVLAENLTLTGRIGTSLRDSTAAEHYIAYGELLTARSLALREQAVGVALLSGTATESERLSLGYLALAQAEAVRGAAFIHSDLELATGEGLAIGETGTAADPVGGAGIAEAREVLAGSDPAAELSIEEWTELSDQQIATLEGQLEQLNISIVTAASDDAEQATTNATLAVGLALAGIVVTILLSSLVARRIAQPLRTLTAAADTARAELPTMVEQMQQPGQLSTVELPRIEMVGRDEIARLAAAFTAANDTIVEVAAQQASLRAAIADTFVNVARRNQVLLSRQLSFIDQLERSEEDPDSLENLFRLDHLATRMRRNAESLLVLAGIDSGRRLRRPLPLSDVIRTAAGEIEQYERVGLMLEVDPPVVGHQALTAAHLLAELLENATNFSEPHTPVVVATSRAEDGVVVTVTDEGLGLTDEEIAEARAKIAEPAADEVVTSQRLGFLVVGRLAQRLGITIDIVRGDPKGLVVSVHLPTSLFGPGALDDRTGTALGEPLSTPSALVPAPAEAPDTESTAPAAETAAPGLPTRAGAQPAGAPAPRSSTDDAKPEIVLPDAVDPAVAGVGSHRDGEDRDTDDLWSGSDVDAGGEPVDDGGGASLPRRGGVDAPQLPRRGDSATADAASPAAPQASPTASRGLLPNARTPGQSAAEAPAPTARAGAHQSGAVGGAERTDMFSAFRARRAQGDGEDEARDGTLPAAALIPPPAAAYVKAAAEGAAQQPLTPPIEESEQVEEESESTSVPPRPRRSRRAAHRADPPSARERYLALGRAAGLPLRSRRSQPPAPEPASPVLPGAEQEAGPAEEVPFIPGSAPVVEPWSEKAPTAPETDLDELAGHDELAGPADEEAPTSWPGAEPGTAPEPAEWSSEAESAPDGSTEAASWEPAPEAVAWEAEPAPEAVAWEAEPAPEAATWEAEPAPEAATWGTEPASKDPALEFGAEPDFGAELEAEALRGEPAPDPLSAAAAWEPEQAPETQLADEPQPEREAEPEPVLWEPTPETVADGPNEPGPADAPAGWEVEAEPWATEPQPEAEQEWTAEPVAWEPATEQVPTVDPSAWSAAPDSPPATELSAGTDVGSTTPESTAWEPAPAPEPVVWEPETRPDPEATAQAPDSDSLPAPDSQSWEPEAVVAPLPAAEPVAWESESESESEQQPEPVAWEPEPEAASWEPAPEPEPEAASWEPAPEPEPEPEPVAWQPEPEPAADLEPEPVAASWESEAASWEPAPEAVSREPEPEPEAWQPDPEPVGASWEPAAEAVSWEPEPEPEPEDVAAGPQPERGVAAGPAPEPVAAPEPIPAPESPAAPQPGAAGGAAVADSEPASPPADTPSVAPPAPEPIALGPVDILPGGRSRRPRRGLFGYRPAAGGSAPPTRPTGSRPYVGATSFSQTSPPPGGGTPTTGGPSGPGGAGGQTPVTAPAAEQAPPPGDDELRQRSLLASEALSELSRLSTYSPSAVEGTDKRTPLTRRQPTGSDAMPTRGAGGAATGLPSRRPTGAAPAARGLITGTGGARRERSATQVRDLLGGFHAGANRGGRARDAARATAPPDSPDSGARRVPASRIPTDDTASGVAPTSATPTATDQASTDAGPTSGATY